MPDFTNPQPSGFIPPGYRPLRPSDIAKVKKSYEITRPKFAKTDSDETVYNFATQTVIDWWKKQKAEEAAANAGSSGGGGTGGGSAPGGSGTGGGSAPGGSGAASGSTATPTKPPTSGATTAPKPPAGNTGQTWGGGVDPGFGPGARAPAPKVLTTTEVAKMLAAAGVPGLSPPPAAKVSAAALSAWITQAKANIAAAKKAAGTYARPPASGYQR